jgi:hypothetical protein
MLDARVGGDGRSAKRHGSGIGEFPPGRVFAHCCLVATYMGAFGTKTTRRCHKVRAMISIRSVHRVGVSVDGHSFDPLMAPEAWSFQPCH